MPKTSRKSLPVDIGKLDQIVDTARQQPLSKSEADALKEAIHSLADQLSWQRDSEKLKRLQKKEQPPQEPKDKAKGHGRNPVSAYESATTVEVPHEELKPGAPCPECPKGKVYPIKPKVLVRLVGQAPVQATVYQLQSLRCNLCQTVFNARKPDGVSDEKYDESVTAMLALLKYGTGLPGNRIETLHARLGVPLPTSTQWELVEDGAEILKPIGRELILRAAQAELVHNDDTRAQILGLIRPQEDKRTGVHTSSILAKLKDYKIALYFTGTNHAGENLGELLALRLSNLPPPIQMCDAASRNVPKLSSDAQTTLANCLAHGRRHVVNVFDNFPEQALHILEALAVPFRVDREAKAQGLAPKQRLRLHQEKSGPVLKHLHRWIEEQLEQKTIEDNSGLGKAVKYLLTHWRKLTLFLTVENAPIDNNLCERAIKKAVLNRKNAYFFRTLNGAGVGDLYLSILHTCELNGVNPFHYLLEALKHELDVREHPEDWMPWNYQKRLDSKAAVSSG